MGLRLTGHPLEPPLGLLEVRVEQLRLDRLEVRGGIDAALGVHHLGIVVGAHHMNDRVGLADVREEPVAESLGYLNIKNSVTIAAEPIAAMKENSIPRPVTGVATWVVGDKDGEVSPDCNRFSIFVSGLSNGWNVDDNHVVRRKTLQLNFKRLGDRFYQDSRDIRFIAPPIWTYRATDIKGTKD